MIHLQAQEGYSYNYGDTVSKDICCPNEDEASKWKLITDAEAEEISKKYAEKMQELNSVDNEINETPTISDDFMD